jgi:hypothetical protein
VILKVFLFARSEGIKKNKKKSKVKIAIFLYLDFSVLAKKKKGRMIKDLYTLFLVL